MVHAMGTHVFEPPQVVPGMTHDHPAPNPKKPWWTWACQSCAPELFEALTEPDYRNVPPAITVCPMCSNATRYGTGRMLAHPREPSWPQDCLASGMSVATAERLFRTIVQGHTIGWFILESRSWRRAHPRTPRDPVQVAYTNLLSQYVGARKVQKMRQAAVGVQFRPQRNVSRISVWETGDVSPTTTEAIHWSKVINRSLVSHTSADACILHTAAEASHRLECLRVMRKVSEEQMAKALGIKVHELQDREDGKAIGKVSLIDLLRWSMVLKSGLSLLELGKI